MFEAAADGCAVLRCSECKFQMFQQPKQLCQDDGASCTPADRRTNPPTPLVCDKASSSVGDAAVGHSEAVAHRRYSKNADRPRKLDQMSWHAYQLVALRIPTRGTRPMTQATFPHSSGFELAQSKLQSSSTVTSRRASTLYNQLRVTPEPQRAKNVCTNMPQITSGTF